MLLTEIVSVLERPRLRRYLSLDEAKRFVTDLASQTTHVTDPPLPHPAICRDPRDDYLALLPSPPRPTRSSSATATCWNSLNHHSQF